MSIIFSLKFHEKYTFFFFNKLNKNSSHLMFLVKNLLKIIYDVSETKQVFFVLMVILLSKGDSGNPGLKGDRGFRGRKGDQVKNCLNYFYIPLSSS